MNQSQVMVDIETFGTVPGSVIVSIGACRFETNGDGWGETFYINVDLQSSLDAGLIVMGSTLEWWFRQTREAQQALFSPKPVKVREALNSFRQWVLETGDFKSTCMWSHGSDFDLVLINAAMEKVNLEVPWMRRKVRDTRTLFALAPGYDDLRAANALPKSGVAHNALDDAKSQLLLVQTAFRLLAGAHVGEGTTPAHLIPAPDLRM